MWKEAQDAHETYLRTLSVASDDEGEDEWIINLQTNFRNAEKAYYEKVIQSNGPSPLKIYKNDDIDGSTQHKLFTERTLKEMKFSNSVTILQHMFKQSHSNESMKVVNEEYKTMKQCYEDVEKAHEAYVLSLGSDTAAAEMNWIVKIQEIYRDCSIKYSSCTPASISAPVSSKKEGTFRIEKMKLPTFNGNSKDYVQFKSDFTKYVLPEIDAKKATFILSHA